MSQRLIVGTLGIVFLIAGVFIPSGTVFFIGLIAIHVAVVGKRNPGEPDWRGMYRPG